MAVRIKSHWHEDGKERSLQEIAGALAYIAWRIAKDKTITLHGEQFVYTTDRQRMDVLTEYLYFQIQIVDRWTHQSLDDQARRMLVTELAVRLADYMQENLEELLGRGDYKNKFIGGLNERSAEYSELRFTDSPSYPFLRHLGYVIQGIMGNRGENRWVIDQVMDKDGPEVCRQLTRAIIDLFD